MQAKPKRRWANINDLKDPSLVKVTMPRKRPQSPDVGIAAATSAAFAAKKAKELTEQRLRQLQGKRKPVAASQKANLNAVDSSKIIPTQVAYHPDQMKGSKTTGKEPQPTSSNIWDPIKITKRKRGLKVTSGLPAIKRAARVASKRKAYDDGDDDDTSTAVDTKRIRTGGWKRSAATAIGAPTKRQRQEDPLLLATSAEEAREGLLRQLLNRGKKRKTTATDFPMDRRKSIKWRQVDDNVSDNSNNTTPTAAAAAVPQRGRKRVHRNVVDPVNEDTDDFVPGDITSTSQVQTEIESGIPSKSRLVTSDYFDG